MKHSEALEKLSPALVKALAELKNPPRTANNPFFKSLYAPLDATLNLTRGVLAENGLAMLQSTESGSDGHPAVVTRIVHESGEWIESSPLIMKPVKEEPQGYGSALTYARRYSLQAMLGITGEADDDGNAASKPSGESKPGSKPATPSSEATPSCPDCGKPMALRTAKQGPNKGGKFWGCTDYPKCTGILSIEDAGKPASEAGKDEGEIVFPAGFGPDIPLPDGYKHSGVNLCEVPNDYLEGMRDKGTGVCVKVAIAELRRREDEGITIEPDDGADKLDDEELPF